MVKLNTSYSHSKITLPNGLRLVTIDMPHIHEVLATMFIRCGSVYETRETNGLSHFLEHVLLAGPKKYSSSAEFRQALDGLGADLEVGVFKERVYFGLTTLPESTERSLATLAEMFASPRFDQRDIEIERQIILEEALKYQDSTGTDVGIGVISSALLWPDHPLGMKILGSPENIKKFTKDDLKNHFQKFFKASNMILCLAGRIGNRENLERFVQKHFSFLEKGTLIEIPKVSEGQNAPQLSFTKRSGQAQINGQICFRALPHGHPQSIALETLHTISGGSGGSRLPTNLCGKQGLVYEIYSALCIFSNTGTLDINFSVSPEKLETVVKEILLELEKMRETVSPGELTRAKARQERNLLSNVSNPQWFSKVFGLSLLLGKVKTPEEILKEVKEVTAQDIVSLARKIFVPQNLNLVVVGPYQTGQEEGVQNIVSKFGENS